MKHLWIVAAVVLVTSAIAQDARITGNRWASGVLIFSGTLSNPEGWPIEFVGFDKDQKVVTQNNDYTTQADGTFQATLSDPKREIKFVKVQFVSAVTASARSREAEVQQMPTITPIPTVYTNANAFPFAGVFVGAIALGILIFIACLVGKSTPNAPSQTATLLPPTPSESAQQELTLADLGKGTPTNHFKLEGFLTKKGETLIWAFRGVKHYQQRIHSEWVGRSSGASVRIMKGLWVRSGASRGHKVSRSQMDCQGEGTLVLTTMGVCFVGASSTRIPFSHILAFQPYEDGIGFDTDYARNNRHIFGPIHAGNVAFIATALDIIKRG
jgi:hypothetical protein